MKVLNMAQHKFFSPGSDSQRSSPISNHQQEMPLLGPVKGMQLVAPDLLKVCRHRLDAIRLCINLSGLSNETICRDLGIDKGHLSRILKGRAHFPDAKSIELMQLCGNYAPMQFEAMALGFELFRDTKAQRRAELEAELAKLNAEAA